MKKQALTLLALLLTWATVTAQFARVQIIHNSPDPTVDVYAGTAKLIDDFVFRTAQPFIDVPAGLPIAIGVAPSSSASSTEAIFTETITFQSGKTYIATASGIVFDPTTPFHLNINADARETATNPNKVDLAVLHGSTDAPAVDIAVRGVGNLFTNVAYDQFTAYTSVDPGVYYIDVKAAGTSSIVQTYRADLTSLTGQAVTIFASGFLDSNSGAPFGLYVALANGTVIALPATPVARLQVIHNSPSPTIDLWMNGQLAIDDFAFRSAIPFKYVPAGTVNTFVVAPDTSTSVNSAIATFPVTFENGKTYIITAQGIVNDPTTGFYLNIDQNARERSVVAGKVDVALIHGSPNAPPVDVDIYNSTTNLFANVSYGETRPYLTFDPGVYYLDVKPAGSAVVVATFKADLSALGGKPVYIVASGLLLGDPAFGLYAVLPDGSMTALPQETPPAVVYARAQIIHNSPDPTVDVYVNGTLALNDFAFRTATPFIDLQANTPLSVAVAPSSSTSVADAIYTQEVLLQEGSTYIIAALGVVANVTTPFNLNATQNGREQAFAPTKVELSVLHGAPDAPAVDIALYGGGAVLFTNVSYGEYADYIPVDPGVYYLDIKPTGTNTVVATFKADLSGLVNTPVVVFASGFLDANNGAAFGLFAALPDGTVIELPQETPPPPATARVQIIHNAPSPTVDVYLDNDLLLNDFAFRTASPFVTVPAGIELNIGVALPGSQSVNDVLITFPVTLDADKTYIIVASGLLGSTTTPFELIINDAAQETAINPANVDVAVLHGAPNAPNVDVDEALTGNLITNLAYGENTAYLGLTPGIYDLAILPSGTSTVVATFRADLSGLAGQAAYVFASGLVGANPAFGLYAALPNGTVITLPLTPLSKVQVIHNAPQPTVDIYVGSRLLIDNFEFRTATPFVNLPAGRNFNIGVALDNSTSVSDVIASFPANLDIAKQYTVMAAGVVGNATTPFNLYIADDALDAAPVGLTAVSVFHGAPDAPAVDVDERLAGNLISGASFGEYTPYLSLPSSPYILDIKPAGSDQIVATYLADLTTLNGAAIRVFASGYLGGNPDFGLYVALADGTVIPLPAISLARVQVVHNSPTPTVDVYAGSDLLLDDFEYQTATEFIYVPAGAEINFGIAPATSQSANDAIANFPVTFENGKTYIVVASGIVGDATTPFTLLVNDSARERATDIAKLELAVLHGATDAPAVDLLPYASDVTLLSNLSYGDFTDYLSLDPGVLILDVLPTGNPNTIVGTFGGDFSQLGGVVGFVMASGKLSGDPQLDLLLVLPNGLVFPLPAYARVNVIHNSPDPAVDVYYADANTPDGVEVIGDFEFRSATGIGLLPARSPFTLAVAPGTSTSIGDAVYTSPELTLETGRTYIVVAAGVVGSADKPFGLYINPDGRIRSGSSSNTDLVLFHGAPDAPEVDVTLPNGTPIFDNVSFGEFADYISVPSASYIVNVTPADNNATIVQSYTADLTPLAGEAAVIFASGYLAPTGAQPDFEVWVALNNGVTFPLPTYVNTNELDNKVVQLSTSPNPTVDQLWLRFGLTESESLRYRVVDLTGRMVLEGDLGTVAAGKFEQKIEVGTLPAGMFMLELVSDAGARSAKFVVQR